MIKYFVALFILIVLAGGSALLFNDTTNPEMHDDMLVGDPKNATYSIEGKLVTLVHGESIVEAGPGPAYTVTTRYFGNEARGDFDNDGDEDIAFILTQNGGGSGTFVYIVASLKNATGYDGTNGILLGDRIAPQTTEFRDQLIVVNYADRKHDEPMSAAPSIGISRYFKIENGLLVEAGGQRP